MISIDFMESPGHQANSPTEPWKLFDNEGLNKKIQCWSDWTVAKFHWIESNSDQIDWINEINPKLEVE